MIEELRIRSLGVIHDAVVEFSPGFTAVTGETGAGKTMVVTGLGLLLGARAEPSLVRGGAEQAEVEGRFVVDEASAAARRVDEVGGSLDEDTMIVRRSVPSRGRSRAFVGGAGVPASVISELAPDLVLVHGQSDQQGLLQPARQRQLLDAFGGLSSHVTSYRAAFDSLRALEAELQTLQLERDDRLHESERLRFGVDEIARVAPTAKEDDDLRVEQERLAHAEDLRDAAAAARAIVDDDSEGALVALAARVRRELESMREHDPVLAALAERAAELGYLAGEMASDLARYVDAIEVDPSRLAHVGQRRAELAALTRKYGSTIPEVLRWAEESSTRLIDLESTDDEVERLTTEGAVTRRRVVELGELLSRERASAAQRLADAVSEELIDLAMPHARMRIEVTQHLADDGLLLSDGRLVHAHADGLDDVAFLLQPHLDTAAQPLGKGASGGELSRIMLALEVVLAGVAAPPTLVFDEVDAGVGGRAAVEVGRRLAQLATGAQVIVVTHLPQVAAFADRHLVVTKSSDGAVTSSDVTTLDDAGRSQELARMLAGLEDSELGRAHANELLALAAEAKGRSR